jgi:hypothetical protein
MLDVGSWFVDPSTGTALVPTDPSNKDIIDENIENSFDADRDDDDNDNDDKDDDNDDT